MATARDYFTQSLYLPFGKVVRISHLNEEFDVHLQVVQDFEGGSKYLKTYIPEISQPEVILAHLLKTMDEMIWKYENDLHMRNVRLNGHCWMDSGFELVNLNGSFRPTADVSVTESLH